MNDHRRNIPSVERLLSSDPFRALLLETPRAQVVVAIRDVQDEQRRDLPALSALDEHGYARAVRQRLQEQSAPSLRPVINATGVVLHTNLGRAPLAQEALEAIQQTAGYSNLECDLHSGTRGSRYDHCSRLLCELTGAEDALVVNNNASALMLALNTLAAEREAIVSRGELVEIGASFRVPDIMARSQARIREVGATNRVHEADYRAAISADTAIVLKVHRSNFRITGFTSEVSVARLAALAHEHSLFLLHDLGSGLLLDLQPFGFPEEPLPQQSLAAGADLVTLSGDKLLGGPQAGIVLGRRELIAQLRRNPMCRALRVDKLTLAALEATLRLYRDPVQARLRVPALRMLTTTAAELRPRAETLAAHLAAHGVSARVDQTLALAGGGAFPDFEFASTGVFIDTNNVLQLETRLRLGEPAVLARVSEHQLVLDMRTIDPKEDAAVERAVLHAWSA